MVYFGEEEPRGSHGLPTSHALESVWWGKYPNSATMGQKGRMLSHFGSKNATVVYFTASLLYSVHVGPESTASLLSLDGGKALRWLFQGSHHVGPNFMGIPWLT